MNYKLVGRIISQILAFEAAFMIPSVILCLYDKDHKTASAFAVSMAIILIISSLGLLLCRNAKKSFHAREGTVCVGLSWVLMSLLGALPFYLSSEIPSFIDAFFETVSGFTTTGASVAHNVEALTRGCLYWRSFSNWVGGMGVLVFLLAIAPMDKGGGSTLHLLRAESPGPSVGKLVPKMKKTAKILYMLYIALTVINVIFLLCGGMPLFDSVCTAFSTAGTGGFGTKSDSIASFSPYIQVVCTVFMILFGINFNCFYLIMLRHFKDVFKNSELKLYLGLILTSSVLITLDLLHGGLFEKVSDAARHGAFQVASIITTTGFASTDFDAWPNLSKGILLCLMLIGACAGSTGGGIKCARVLLLFKSFTRSIRSAARPQRVQVMRLNGQVIDETVLSATNVYLVAYVVIMVISFLIVSVDGFSVTTNVSAVASCFNNIGPGFEKVGPAANYSQFSIVSKITLIIDMLAGRLEIFPILTLLAKDTWKN